MLEPMLKKIVGGLSTDSNQLNLKMRFPIKRQSKNKG